MSPPPSSPLSPRRGKQLLLLLLALLAVLSGVYFQANPTPAHSSHDGFLLIPQLQSWFLGYLPENPSFGTFHATFFHGPLGAADTLSWGPLQALFLNQWVGHWVQVPHPQALAAAASVLFPGSLLAPGMAHSSYLLLLIAAVYGIGARLGSPAHGLLAAILASGSPGIFGFSHYLESHLPVCAMGAVVLYLALASEGFRRRGICLLFSVAAWSLSRSGEGAAEVVGSALSLGLPLAWLVGKAVRDKGENEADRRRIRQGLALALLPLLVCTHWAWINTCIGQVLTGFRDPVVQLDVVADAGGLSSDWSWIGAYGILLFTDYLGPVLGLFFVIALIPAARDSRLRLVWGWFLVPLVAYSIMPRKASWYAISLLPPVALLLAFGLLGVASRWRRRGLVGLASVVALLQVVLFPLVPRDSRPDWFEKWAQPVPLDAWQLRRVDLTRPVDEAGKRALQDQAAALVDWLAAEVPSDDRLKRLGLITMGYKHDYALRYLLGVARPDLEVVNLGDPVLRASLYRGLSPHSIEFFAFVDTDFQAWPPGEEQRAWLGKNLQCGEDDPVDVFLGALLARDNTRVAIPGAGEVLRFTPPLDSSQGAMRGALWRVLQDTPQLWPEPRVGEALCD